MRQREFYQAVREKLAAGCPDLTAVTVLEGPAAGTKYLLEGEKEAERFRQEHAGLRCFEERLGRTPRLLVFGAGHVSRPIIRIGKMLGFSVTVLEDRPKFADDARRAGADLVICESFREGLRQVEPDQDTYAVIVTRGHRYDEDCLYGLLSMEREKGLAFAYIGMMGSRRRTAMVREHMEELGIDRAQVERVHAPIGLPIGAETPEEIAVSVFGEIIQVKSGKGLSEGYSGALLAAVPGGGGSESGAQQAVLATIIARQGSAPRSVGTKMLVRADGTTVGTIGGGCAESAVMHRALQMMRFSDESDFALAEVDMTAREAEEEGMVCGGHIRVLLERL